MAHKYILDTHALIWFLEGNKRLSSPAKSTMSTQNNQMILPIIALAEAVLIIELKRTTISNVSRFLKRVYADSRIEVFPLTLDVFERSLSFEGQKIPELHDRLIVSTGLHLQDLGDSIEIITKDQAITEANVLPVVW